MSDIYLSRDTYRTLSTGQEISTGKTIVTHHFVWNAERFIDSQRDEQAKLRADKKDFQLVGVVDRDAYRAFAWPKR